MDVLYLVMPAYNEEANIEEVVRDWYAVLEDKPEESRLVVADSGSTDRTHEILLSLQQDLPQLEILEDTAKEHGPKLMALYRYAIEQKADYIFQTDSDGQTDPREFRVFWERHARYDAIIGNRIDRKDGWKRAAVEKTVCLLLRRYFGVKVPDANAPFRLMRADAVAEYLDRLPDDYALPNIMLTAFLVGGKKHVLFREISFRPRAGGTNSMNIRRITKIGTAAIGDFRQFRKTYF